MLDRLRMAAVLMVTVCAFVAGADYAGAAEADTDAVRTLVERWAAMPRSKDPTAFEEILAPDYVGTSSTGRTRSRAEVIAAHRGDTAVYATTETTDLVLDQFAPNVITATGTFQESGKEGDTEFSRRFRFLDVFVERSGQWQCVASQTSRLGDN